MRDIDLVVDAVGGALFPIYPLGFVGTEEADARGVTVSATQLRSNGARDS